MKSIKLIKLFISCPGDIQEEIESIELIIKEINKTSGKQNDYSLELLNWKYDTYTDIGSDGQEVINNQLENQYDILIGILWTKAGTPTKRDKSGTIEEINRALQNKSKEQIIYFKTSSPENINNIDPAQFAIIKEFKKDLSERGVLYKEFNSLDSFESLFRVHITNLIVDKILHKNIPIVEAEPIVEIEQNKSQKYTDILELISEVESKDDTAIDIDILNLFEEAQLALESITATTESMTSTMNFLTERLNYRTDELNRINKIKDIRLKKTKAVSSIEELSLELLDFSSRLDLDVPIFAENFNQVSKSYSKILLAFSGNESDDFINMKNQMKSFRDTIEFSLKNSAVLLKTISDFPLINSKFNQSKRQSELSIKNITQELLDGLLLLDEVINN